MTDRSQFINWLILFAALGATPIANAQAFQEESRENVSEESTPLGFEIPGPDSAPDFAATTPLDSEPIAIPGPPAADIPSKDAMPDNSFGNSDPFNGSSNQDVDTPQSTGPTDLKLTREQLIAVFQGNFSTLPTVEKLFPPLGSLGSTSPVGQFVPSGRNVWSGVPPAFDGPANRNSNGFIAPSSRTLKRSPEQCLAIMVTEVEQQIARHKRELNESKDDEQQEALLKKLGESYQLRFELDTAFQDFKVAEIERRAKKLRADVEAREKATQQWVDAMVTLAKMKANGIETMNSTPAQLAPTSAVAPTTIYGLPSTPTQSSY